MLATDCCILSSRSLLVARDHAAHLWFSYHPPPECCRVLYQAYRSSIILDDCIVLFLGLVDCNWREFFARFVLLLDVVDRWSSYLWGEFKATAHNSHCCLQWNRAKVLPVPHDTGKSWLLWMNEPMLEWLALEQKQNHLVDFKMYLCYSYFMQLASACIDNMLWYDVLD